MKNRNQQVERQPQRVTTNESKPGLVEFGLLALPLVALTPNFFVAPALSMMGLATQELAFAIYALLMGGAALWESWRGGREKVALDRQTGLLLGALGLFIAWQLVSLAWAPTPSEGLRLTGIWLLFGFFAILGAGRLGTTARGWLTHILTLVCLILALTIIYERYLYGQNMLGFFFNHGITAEILVTLIPLQLASYFKSRNRLATTAYLVVSALAIGAVLIGLRRGALLGLVISLSLLGLAWLFRLVDLGHPKRVLVIASLVLITAGTIGGIYWSEVVIRYEGATKLTASEGGLSTRLRGWLTAAEMVKAHPIIGIGQAGYAARYGEWRKAWVNQPENASISSAAGPEDYDEIRSPLVHNEYFETLVELGLIGLLLFSTFWVLLGSQLFQQMRQTRGHLPAGALFGLLAFGISSLTSGLSFRYTPGTMILAALIGAGLKLGPGGEEASDVRGGIELPGWLRSVAVAILVIVFALMTWRAQAVFESQRLQGLETLNTEQLDFAFYPDDPSGNERLTRRYEQVLRLDPTNSGAHLGYAVLLYQLKRNREALPHAEYAWKNGYSRPFGYVLTAFIHEQLGEMPQAIAILEDGAASYPQSPFIRASLVEMLRRTGQVDEMRRHQAEMYARDRRTMMSWELYLRTSRQKAIEEAKRENLMSMSSFNENLAITLVAMRAHHYHGN
jgi:O-antigen ligase